MTSIEHTVGIFTTDTNLVIRSWDAWLARATGIPTERARGRRLVELFPDLEARGMLARFERVLREGVVEVLAPRFHHYLIACAPPPTSNRFDKMQQRVTIAPLREGQAIVGAIATIEDVTARLEREREMAEQLASADEAARLRAAQALADEAQESSDTLLGVIGDESWRVRRAAVDGLARRAGSDEIKVLLRAIREEHRDPGVLNSALQVLALSGVDAVAPLVELLGDPDTDLRIYATHALGDQHDPRAVPALIRALEDADTNVRYHAIEALGKLRATDAVDVLAATAETHDFHLAFPALDALVSIGDSRVAPRLVPLLEDDLLRSPAAEALGQLGDEEVTAPLVALLNTPGAPALVIAQALAALYDRYDKLYHESAYIADLARRSINEAGVENLLNAIDAAAKEDLRSLALVLGWMEGEAVERAMIKLLGQPTARKEVIEALVRYGERVTRLLTEQLNGESEEARKAAVIALGRIGDPRAVPALIEVLGDERDLTITAAGALGKIGDRRAFEALLELIGRSDAAVRQAAVSAINSLGHPEMAGRAVELLRDQDPHVRESAVKIAGYFGYPQCVELLLERCHDEEESVRRAAIEHIPYLEDPRAVEALRQAIENETPRVRAAAAAAFSHMESSVALPYLLAALNDEDAWVRYFAARSIGLQSHTESLEALARLAESDPASQVRIAAIEALSQIGGPRAVAVLARLAEADDADLARAALRSLGQIGHPDALQLLVETLRSPDSARRVEALKALGQRGREGVAEAISWIAAADRDANVAEAAIDALARLATPEAVNALIVLTADSARREAVVDALARLGEHNVELIGRGLTNTQPSVRRAVVEVLGRMKQPSASEQLGAALDDKDAGVRLAAVNAISHLGNRNAERKLISLMHADPDTAVRRAAQRALRR
jgi:HEAT repeat protein